VNDEDGVSSLWEYLLGGKMWIGFLKGVNGFNAMEVVDVERRTSGSWLTTIMLGFSVLVLTTGWAPRFASSPPRTASSSPPRPPHHHLLNHLLFLRRPSI
jgi:hypothetical protein